MLIRGREQDDPIRGSSLVSKGASRLSSFLPRTPPQPQGHRVGQGERTAAGLLAAPTNIMVSFSLILQDCCTNPKLQLITDNECSNHVSFPYLSPHLQQSVFTDHNALKREPLHSFPQNNESSIF